MKIYNIVIALMTLMLCGCSLEEGHMAGDFYPSELTISVGSISDIEVSGRATEDVTDGTLHGRLDALMVCLVDESGSVVESRAIQGDDLLTADQLRFNVGKGVYNLYLLGDGKNTSFSDTRLELQSPVASQNSNWITTIAWFTARKEWFHGSFGPIMVDGSGGALSGSAELKRVVGRVDVTMDYNASTTIIGSYVGFDLGVIPTSLTVDGRYIHPDPKKAQHDGSGNYCLFNAPARADRLSFFCMPTVGSMFSGRIFVTYQENGAIRSKFIPIDNYSIQPNRITHIKVKVNS